MSVLKLQTLSEDNHIEQLAIEVKRIDPDFIFTNNGDSLTFPRSIHRAEANGISRNLI